jgi:hypothetical protein
VKRVPTPGDLSALLLCLSTTFLRLCDKPAGAGTAGPHAVAQYSALLVCQLDVPDPETDRRLGDAEKAGKLFDRKALIPTQASCFLALHCFHFRQQRSGWVGRSGRRESDPCPEGGNLVLCH